MYFNKFVRMQSHYNPVQSCLFLIMNKKRRRLKLNSKTKWLLMGIKSDTSRDYVAVHHTLSQDLSRGDGSSIKLSKEG